MAQVCILLLVDRPDIGPPDEGAIVDSGSRQNGPLRAGQEKLLYPSGTRLHKAVDHIDD
jgi:hypothetical protein